MKNEKLKEKYNFWISVAAIIVGVPYFIYMLYLIITGYKPYIFGCETSVGEVSVGLYFFIIVLNLIYANVVDEAEKAGYLKRLACALGIIAALECFCFAMRFNSMFYPRQLIYNFDGTKVMLEEYKYKLFEDSPERSEIYVKQLHFLSLEKIGVVNSYDFPEVSPLERGMCRYSYDETAKKFKLMFEYSGDYYEEEFELK
ncbi:MAG: hypothetical protein J6A07_06865 [Firmicutes bacterium]|nr:hypothetical protein [Bacillota bacterium]